METDEAKDKMAQALKADLFISGHVHINVLEKRGNTVFLNPGSPSLSKREDGRATVAVLEDKKITDDERNQLMAFFSNVIDFSSSANLSEKEFAQLREKYSVGGICAVCPEIKFKGRTFCFTGESYRAKRLVMAETVRGFGGMVQSAVNRKTNYLIVGTAGNPCWAYACYGRKIEEAMQLRKEGVNVVIVNETDFWDAVDDANAGIPD